MHTLTDNRCDTAVTNTRSDELTLGARVLVSSWDGTVSLRTVTGLRLLNDTVEIDFAYERSTTETTCKIGTVWQVASVRVTK